MLLGRHPQASAVAPYEPRPGNAREPTQPERVCRLPAVVARTSDNSRLPLSASSVLGSSEPSGRCIIRYFARGLPGWGDGRNASRPGRSRVNGPDKNWVARYKSGFQPEHFGWHTSALLPSLLSPLYHSPPWLPVHWHREATKWSPPPRMPVQRRWSPHGTGWIFSLLLCRRRRKTSKTPTSEAPVRTTRPWQWWLPCRRPGSGTMSLQGRLRCASHLTWRSFRGLWRTRHFRLRRLEFPAC